MNNHSFFERALFESTGKDLQISDLQFMSGGCINNAVKVITNQGSFFLKWNESSEEDMFATEANSLRLLRADGSLKIPEVLGVGKTENKHYLLLEYIESAIPSGLWWEKLGQGLASLHKHTAGSYGLNEDNYIGRLPQKNEQSVKWTEFFRENRLEVQLGLAIYNGLADENFVRRYRSLYPKLEELLPEEKPALLHGDLWSGNVMAGEGGEPWLFDPAVYFGHREAELAFTELFGGFDPPFYQAYEEAFPLADGYHDRKDLYNIYPLMVHVNTFGTSYLSGVERALRKYL